MQRPALPATCRTAAPAQITILMAPQYQLILHTSLHSLQHLFSYFHIFRDRGNLFLFVIHHTPTIYFAVTKPIIRFFKPTQTREFIYNQLVSIVLCRQARKLDANTGYRCTSRTAIESGRTPRAGSDLITWQQPRSPRPRPALSTPQWNSSAPIDSLNRVINNLNTWSVGGDHYHRKYFIALNIVKRAEG